MYGRYASCYSSVFCKTVSVGACRFLWSFHNEFFVPVGVRFSMYLSCASASSFLSALVSLRKAAFNLLFAPGDLCCCHSLRCRRFSSTSSSISLLVLLDFVLHTWLSCGVDAFAAATSIDSISPANWSMSCSVYRGLEKPVGEKTYFLYLAQLVILLVSLHGRSMCCSWCKRWKIIGQLSDESSGSASAVIIDWDILFVMAKRIKSGSFMGSAGQYVGAPGEHS